MKSGSQLYVDHYKGKFEKGEISEEQLSQMVSDGTLEEDEKQYIMGVGTSELEGLRAFHSEVMAKVRGE